MEKLRKEAETKALLVKILQWFYILLGVGTVSGIIWYKQIPLLDNLNLPQIFVYVFIGSITFYCLVLAAAFFTQNTTLLIFSLVLVFFTTFLALILFVISLPNASTVLNGNLPDCINNLVVCSQKDGIIVASAALLSVSVPTLTLNIITIIGTVKAIAATD